MSAYESCGNKYKSVSPAVTDMCERTLYLFGRLQGSFFFYLLICFFLSEDFSQWMGQNQNLKNRDVGFGLAEAQLECLHAPVCSHVFEAARGRPKLEDEHSVSTCLLR